MAVECDRCSLQTARVRFRRPEKEPKRLNHLRVLMLASTAIALFGLYTLLQQVLPMTDLADAMEAAVNADENVAPEIRDAVHIFTNATYLLFTAVLVTSLYIPIRYIVLYFAIPRGHPRTLWSLRRLAWTQMGVAIAGLIVVFIIVGATEALQVDPRVGLQLFVAPVILWYTYHPAVRQQFSDFAIKPVPVAEGGFELVDDEGGDEPPAQQPAY